jgi:hypothetical protein
VPRAGTRVVCGGVAGSTIQKFRATFEFQARNAWLEISSTDDRTTPALAGPSSAETPATGEGPEGGISSLFCNLL